MKKVYLAILILIGTTSVYAQQLSLFVEEIDVFFQDNVKQHKVDYVRVKQVNQKHLLEFIAEADFQKWTTKEQKAFYINAYNFLIIQAVMQEYPILSPDEVLDFWDNPKWKVAGQSFSLAKLKTYILEEFQDRRLLFVLSDATNGGSPAQSFAFNPARLEEQIELCIAGIVNNSRFVKVDAQNKRVLVPFLFKKYSNHIGLDWLEFINQYRTKKIEEVCQVEYSTNDRSLNELKIGNSAKIGDSTKKKHKKTAITTAQSLTLSKGVFEMSTYQSVFTARIGNLHNGYRSSFYNGWYSLNYGLTDKVDFGINVIMRSSRENDHVSSSPFKTLLFERTTTVAARYRQFKAEWGVSHLGLNVRFSPFKKHNFTFEQAVYVPIRDLPTGNQADENYYFVSQLYYYYRFNHKADMLLGLTFWQPVRPGNTFRFQLPMLRMYLNWYASYRVNLFVTTMYGMEWGAGARVLLAPNFEINVMYSYVLPIPTLIDLILPGGKDIMTYNLGLRYRF